jgi:lysophospholipase L1-like esterase
MRRFSGTGIILGLMLLLFSSLEARDYHVFDVVGDSISYGVNPQLGTYGWVQMLLGEGGGGYPVAQTTTLYTLWPSMTAYNSALSGAKASDWASNNYSLLSTVVNHHPDLVVVFIGGNDFLAYAADGNVTNEEFQQFRSNLISIVDTLQSNFPKPTVLLVNYYDLFDGYSQYLPSSTANYQGLSATVVAGNQIISEVAVQKGCSLINIYEPFYHHCYGIYFGDTGHILPDYVAMPLTNFNIHPTTAGHLCIYSRVLETLKELQQTPVSAWELYP